MSFVFGWYSFKVKSYTSQDLQLTNYQSWNNATFEVRQKVFHLFWLPFFGLGKTYVFKKNGETFDAPPNVIFAIKSKGKPRTPWYTFFIPVLAIAIGLGFLIHYGVWKYNKYTHYKNNYETAIIKIEQELPNLTTNHYLKIADFSNLYKSQGLFLKLKAKENKKYTFLILDTKLEDSEAFPYKLIDFYETNKETLKTIVLTEKELKNAICIDHSIYKNKTSYGIKILDDEKKYSIESIKYLDGSYITGRNFTSWKFWDLMTFEQFQTRERFIGDQTNRVWNLKLELKNYGKPVKLVEIKNLENTIEWTDSLPISFETTVKYKYFEVNGSIKKSPEAAFKVLLIFEDSDAVKQNYILEGKQERFTIKRQI